MREKRLDVPGDTVKRLRQEIENNGWSSSQVARKLGVSRQVLSQAIGPQRRATASLLDRLERLLDPARAQCAPADFGGYVRGDLEFLEGDWIGFREEYDPKPTLGIVRHVISFYWDDPQSVLRFQDASAYATYSGRVALYRTQETDAGSIGLANNVDGLRRVTNLMMPLGREQPTRLSGGTLTVRPLNRRLVVSTGPIFLRKQERPLSREEVEVLIKQPVDEDTDLIYHELSIVKATCLSKGWR